MARAATVAAPAPTPWSARRATANGASMGRRNEKLAMPYTTRPARSTGRRPTRSASLPMGYWESTPAA